LKEKEQRLSFSFLMVIYLFSPLISYSLKKLKSLMRAAFKRSHCTAHHYIGRNFLEPRRLRIKLRGLNEL